MILTNSLETKWWNITTYIVHISVDAHSLGYIYIEYGKLARSGMWKRTDVENEMGEKEMTRNIEIYIFHESYNVDCVVCVCVHIVH